MGKKKLKNPSGLSVTRNGYKFTFSWKIPATNYYDKIAVEYRVNGEVYTKKNGNHKKGDALWHRVNSGKEKSWKNKTTTGPITLSNAKTIVAFRIQAHTSQSGFKSKTTSWIPASYVVSTPLVPGNIIAAVDNDDKNATTFAWSLSDTGATSKRWFLHWARKTRYMTCNSVYNKKTKKYETKITDSAPGWKGSWINGGKVGDASGSVRHVEIIGSNRAFARMVAVKSVGRKAESKIKYGCHVYAQPQAVQNLKIAKCAVNRSSQMTTASLMWTENYGSKVLKNQNWRWFPIDYLEVECVMAPPAAGGAVPANTQGSTLRRVDAIASDTAKARSANGTNIELNSVPEPNACLYFRVKSVHDDRSNLTSWIRAAGIASSYSLTDPVLAEPQYSGDYKTAQITVENTALEVADSMIVLTFKTVKNLQERTYGYIGVIEHGETSTTVQIPVDIAEYDEAAIGAQAISIYRASTYYQPVSSFASATDSTITQENFAILKNDLYTKSGSSYIKVGASDTYRSNVTYYSRYKDIKINRGYGRPFKNYYFWGASYMSSKWVFRGGEVPTPPASFDVELVGEVARTTWEWSWSRASSIELSWADHDDAWESTDGPSTYRVNRVQGTRWNIAGLTTGETWYFRARFVSVYNDVESPGPWTETKSLNLASAPERPRLNLSKPVVTRNEKFVASWVYTSTDGTIQDSAEIFEVYGTESEPVYGSYRSTLLYSDMEFDASATYYVYEFDDVEQEYTYSEVETPVEEDCATYYIFDSEYPVASLPPGSTAQNMTLVAMNLGWETGRTYNLALRLKSASNVYSRWSTAVTISVAEPLEPPAIPEIDGIMDETFTVVPLDPDTGEELPEETESRKILTKLPITVNITGAGVNGTTILAIERAKEYFLDRPDETDYEGYENETVYLHRQTGEDPITINASDDELTGSLDDGAWYRMVARIIDENQQTAENRDTIFMVRWNHQPAYPKATVAVDNENLIAKITPIQPTSEDYGDIIINGEVIHDDFDPEDTFDIYRLSTDAPELIVSNGTFGTTYVDPYPAIGEYGGHRVVFKTKYRDYITARGEYAWDDFDEEDGDILKTSYNIINFGSDEVQFRYNLDLSNSWKKDFKETKYLGGSVVGDWNPAVSRTGTVATVVARDLDQETIRAMRRLADYAGICHVRTKDGSSYAANVEVSENWSYNSSVIISYSLSITRVDSEGLDGLTLSDWEAMNTEEEGE